MGPDQAGSLKLGVEAMLRSALPTPSPEIHRIFLLRKQECHQVKGDTSHQPGMIVRHKPLDKGVAGVGWARIVLNCQRNPYFSAGRPYLTHVEFPKPVSGSNGPRSCTDRLDRGSVRIS